MQWCLFNVLFIWYPPLSSLPDSIFLHSSIFWLTNHPDIHFMGIILIITSSNLSPSERSINQTNELCLLAPKIRQQIFGILWHCQELLACFFVEIETTRLPRRRCVLCWGNQFILLGKKRSFQWKRHRENEHQLKSTPKNNEKHRWYMMVSKRANIVS